MRPHLDQCVSVALTLNGNCARSTVGRTTPGAGGVRPLATGGHPQAGGAHVREPPFAGAAPGQWLPLGPYEPIRLGHLPISGLLQLFPQSPCETACHPHRIGIKLRRGPRTVRRSARCTTRCTLRWLALCRRESSVRRLRFIVRI